MSKRLAGSALVLCLLVSVPCSAFFQDISAVWTDISGTQITIVAGNSNSSSTTSRVTVTVLLDDGSYQTLTSANFVVSPNGSATITLTASRPIVGIGDDPQPFPPS